MNTVVSVAVDFSISSFRSSRFRMAIRTCNIGLAARFARRSFNNFFAPVAPKKAPPLGVLLCVHKRLNHGKTPEQGAGEVREPLGLETRRLVIAERAPSETPAAAVATTRVSTAAKRVTGQPTVQTVRLTRRNANNI